MSQTVMHNYKLRSKSVVLDEPKLAPVEELFSLIIIQNEMAKKPRKNEGK